MSARLHSHLTDGLDSSTGALATPIPFVELDGPTVAISDGPANYAQCGVKDQPDLQSTESM